VYGREIWRESEQMTDGNEEQRIKKKKQKKRKKLTY